MRETTIRHGLSLTCFLATVASIKTLYANWLRGDGVRVWFDDWQIQLGDSIPTRIAEGLEGSRVLLLLLLSEHFDQSDWTRYEAGTFQFNDPENKQRRFIPVRLDESQFPFRIRHHAWLDWRQREESAYQSLLATCVSSRENSQTQTIARHDRPDETAHAVADQLLEPAVTPLESGEPAVSQNADFAIPLEESSATRPPLFRKRFLSVTLKQFAVWR